MIRDYTDNLRKKLDAFAYIRTIGSPLLFYYDNNDNKLLEDEELWITSSTPLDGYANEIAARWDHFLGRIE